MVWHVKQDLLECGMLLTCSQVQQPLTTQLHDKTLVDVAFLSHPLEPRSGNCSTCMKINSGGRLCATIPCLFRGDSALTFFCEPYYIWLHRNSAIGFRPFRTLSTYYIESKPRFYDTLQSSITTTFLYFTPSARTQEDALNHSLNSGY